jgi:nitrogen fixation/metabolism regulation signal transduction histidine kinase
MTVAAGRNDDNKKVTKVISTKLSIEDHKTFRILTDLTYQYGGIKEDTKTILKVVSTDSGGTGLGLFISKNIIESHGGRIWAENNIDGKGVHVSFSLPLKINC